MARARPLSRDELSEQLTRASDARSGQDTIVWTVFGVFSAANAVFAGLLLQPAALHSNLRITAAGLLGLFLTMVWFVMHRRALGHQARLEWIVEDIEVALQIPEQLRLSRRTGRERWKWGKVLLGIPKNHEPRDNPYLSYGPRARSWMHFVILAVAVFWVVVALSATVKLFIARGWL